MPLLQPRGSSEHWGQSMGEGYRLCKPQWALPTSQMSSYKVAGPAPGCLESPPTVSRKGSLDTGCGSWSPKWPSMPCLLVLCLCIVPSHTESWLICAGKIIQSRWWYWLLSLHHKRPTLTPCSLSLLPLKGAVGIPEQPYGEAHLKRNGGLSPIAHINLSGIRAEADPTTPGASNILATLPNSWLTETVRSNKWLLLL